MTSSLCFGEMATSCWREKQALLITPAERSRGAQAFHLCGSYSVPRPLWKWGGPRASLNPHFVLAISPSQEIRPGKDPFPPSSPVHGSAMPWCAGAERKGGQHGVLRVLGAGRVHSSRRTEEGGTALVCGEERFVFPSNYGGIFSLVYVKKREFRTAYSAANGNWGEAGGISLKKGWLWLGFFITFWPKSPPLIYSGSS